jgi:hypothetical protein
MEIKPRCSNIQKNVPATAVTRVIATSLSNSLTFTVDGVVSYEIVYGDTDTRKRFRATGAEVTVPELRLFFVVSAPNVAELPKRSMKKIDCSALGSQICFEVSVSNSKWRFEFKKDSVGHYLNCVRAANASGAYSNTACSVYEITTAVLNTESIEPNSDSPVTDPLSPNDNVSNGFIVVPALLAPSIIAFKLLF